MCTSFGKGWGAFLTALVGVHVHLVVYGYTVVNPTPQVVKFKVQFAK